MYENSARNLGAPNWHVQKILRIMRLTTLLLMLFMVQVSAAGYGQRVTLSHKKASLGKLFREIHNQTGYDFLYDAKKISEKAPVDINVTDRKLEEVLDLCFKGQNLEYSIEDKAVIVREIKNSAKKSIPIDIDSRPYSLQISISGSVRDTLGKGLPGVSIKIKGTSRGASTDPDGRFSIVVPGPESVLVVSYVGFITREITVRDSKILDIVLKENSDALDEVAVVAFGTQKKSSMVSSITTINPKELKVPSSNLTTALAGRLSGVIAYQRSGEPGRDNADFFIRGVTTFGYKRDPLILINGVETTTQELARLQVDDIAAFSILKDATATALYGARGANGVVQVTTKEGAQGSAVISFRAENSFSSNTKDIELADPVTFMRAANEANLTRDPLSGYAYSLEKIDGTISGENPLLYPVTDWRKMLIKDVTANQRYNLSVSGGGAIARYYISGALNQDNGNLKVDKTANFNNNINLKSYQLRSNVNINVTKTTEIIARLAGSFDDYNGPVDGGEATYKKIMRSNQVLFPAFYPASMMPSTKHILFGNASRGDASSGASYSNPYADLVKGYKDSSKSLLEAQFELKQNLDFVTPGFSASGMFNTSRYSYFDVNRFYNPYFYNISYYEPQTNQYTLSLLNEANNPTEYLNYNEGGKDISTTLYLQANLMYTRQFSGKHDLSGLLVFQRRQQLLANQGTLQKSLPYRNQGLSGRFTYGYDNRYLLEMTFGYNGSERFDRSHRYGFFPAIGGGWVVSNEKFWTGIKEVVQKLKLKGTYGLVGNDAIGDANDRFFYLSELNTSDGGKAYTFGENYDYTKNGFTINRYENRDISWEKAYKTNIGIEVGFLRGFEFQADYFSETRENILMDRASIPASVGLAANPRANVGRAKANGLDMSLDYNKSFNNSFWLQMRGNFTYAHSEYLQYEEPAYNEKYLLHVGQPIDQIFGLLAERLFVDQYDVNNSPRQTYGEYGPGDIKYRDMNGDGQITDLDKVPIGFPRVPEIIYGFGFSTGYKGFDLSAFFQGSARSTFWLDGSNTSPFQNDIPLLKAYADDHWSEQNRNLYAMWPRFDPKYNGNNLSQYSTWFMRNGAFLRLKTLELGYSLSKDVSKKLFLSSARFYASGNNLFLLSGFKMWDIEMGGNGLGYPVQKVFNFGVQVKF